MRITLEEDGLLIRPDTEFEDDFLGKKFGLGKTIQGYIKTGLSVGDIVGVKINFNERNDDEKN